MLKENLVKVLTSHNLVIPIFVSLLFFFNGTGFAGSTTIAGTAATAKSPPPSDNQKVKNTKIKDTKIKDKKLNVTSDKMVAQKNSSMVEFIGNVKATREDAIIFADSIKVFINSSETKAQGQNSLKKIIATGNVEYTAGERKAFADKAVYTTKDEILILTGKTAKLISGTSHVTGKKITLFRNEDRAIVESDGKTRVQAVFNPEDQKKGKTK
jgi:lipopolysaccharide export system protein LptA